MSRVPKFTLGVDVEASGMGLRTNFCAQVGLGLVDVESGEELARFSTYVAQPPGTTWEERCVREFWEKHPDQWERVKRGIATAPPVGEVALAIKDFFRMRVVDPVNTRVVSDTPGFDLAWIDTILGDTSYLYWFTDPQTGLPMYQDVLDVGSWYLGLARVCDPAASALGESRRALGVKEEPDLGVEHDHDAANDAVHIAKRAAWAFRRARELYGADYCACAGHQAP